VVIRLEHGDCIEVMRGMPDGSVDAIVCDPPYGIGFMGKGWDSAVPGIEWARESLRVLKPGGHLIAFASTRTLHRLAVAVEDGGFEIRDTVHWCYWSGFPKSLDVSKAIDAAAGAEREVIRESTDRRGDGTGYGLGHSGRVVSLDPATDAARQWSGWGTALKPAVEPAVLARKPLSGTVAANVLEHGTGGLNIDGCRIAPGDEAWPGPQDEVAPAPAAAGRWPANLYHCPKPSTAERERGTEGLPARSAGELVDRDEGSAGMDNPRAGAGRTSSGRRNFHPTVKPVQLMRWLVRLVTPPGGVVLDPFMGSGTTGIAAAIEGFDFIGIEREAEYLAIANARVRYAAAHRDVESPVDAPEREQVTIFDALRGAE